MRKGVWYFVHDPPPPKDWSLRSAVVPPIFEETNVIWLKCFSDRASWIDYTLVTNLMHWLLFIHKILFSWIDYTLVTNLMQWLLFIHKILFSWIDYTLVTNLMHWLLFIHKILFAWIDYTLITNLMHWLLFIHKILFSCTCFEHQVLIFRRT